MNEIWRPSSIHEDFNGAREVRVMAEHLSRRRVFLTGPITRDSVDEAIAQLTFLDDNPGEVIHLVLNSEGGEFYAGMTLYDVIQGLQSPLTIWCTGMAASMAATILAGGRKGRRFILPHARTMIHEPAFIQDAVTSVSSMRNLTKYGMQIRKTNNELLAKHTGKSLKEIDKATSFDNYMNAEESVEFGLADAVKERLFS